MSEEREGLFAGRTALILGSVLVCLFAVLACLAAFDRAQRPRLEQLSDPSALNDPVEFFLPETSATGSQTASSLPTTTGTSRPLPVAVVHGIPQFAVRRYEWEDGRMRKTGTDDSGKYPIYRHFERNNQQNPSLWLRFAPNQYVEFSPEPSPSPSTESK